MLFISFDCGIKNLGVAIAQYDTTALDRLRAMNTCTARQLADFCRNLLRIKLATSFDLIPGSKINQTSLQQRTCRMKEILDSLSSYGRPDHVLIEYQMGPNSKTRDVVAGLMMYYAPIPTHLIKPALKNAIWFGPEGAYSNFISRYSRYTANKKHALHNFLEFCRRSDQLKVVDQTQNMRDAADAFMMLYAALWFGTLNITAA